MGDKTGIGDRMKENYEGRYRLKLTRRTPVIMRLDGKAFHTLTKGCEKPFDERLSGAMLSTTWALLKEIQGSKCAYIQSDEISILITDFEKLTTEAWFDYNIQKMCSVSAGIASTRFSQAWFPENEGVAVFDSRVFNIPKEEVCNYFIWRQQDWTRNSVHMAARSHFSHKELHGKNVSNMHEMLHKIGINWNDFDSKWKNGLFVEGHWEQGIKTPAHPNFVLPTPIFTQEREVVEKYLIQE